MKYHSKIVTISITVILGLSSLGCVKSDAQFTPVASPTSQNIECTFDPKVVDAIKPFKSALWSLMPSGLDQIVVALDQTEVSKYVTNDKSCILSVKIGFTSIFSNEDLLDRTSISYENLSLTPGTTYPICITAWLDNGTSSNYSSTCTNVRVPVYTPPNPIKCAPFLVTQNTVWNGLDATSKNNITASCAFSDWAYGHYYAFSNASNVMIGSWLNLPPIVSFPSPISVSTLRPGNTYSLMTKSVNRDGYYTINTTSFSLPKEVYLSIMYKSKTNSSAQVFSCSGIALTYENFLPLIASMYPACNLISPYGSYLLDCTQNQYCSPTGFCEDIQGVGTSYGFCANYWSLPLMSISTSY